MASANSTARHGTSTGTGSPHEVSGFAVHHGVEPDFAPWREVEADEVFPTADGKLHNLYGSVGDFDLAIAYSSSTSSGSTSMTSNVVRHVVGVDLLPALGPGAGPPVGRLLCASSGRSELLVYCFRSVT